MQLVDVLLRRESALVGRLLDLLPVLVGPGQEVHLIAEEAAKARHRVDEHRAVRVPDVRLRVEVVQRGRVVEALGGHLRVPVGGVADEPRTPHGRCAVARLCRPTR